MSRYVLNFLLGTSDTRRGPITLAKIGFKKCMTTRVYDFSKGTTRHRDSFLLQHASMEVEIMRT